MGAATLDLNSDLGAYDAIQETTTDFGKMGRVGKAWASGLLVPLSRRREALVQSRAALQNGQVMVPLTSTVGKRR
jgi:hypothetical protein